MTRYRPRIQHVISRYFPPQVVAALTTCERCGEPANARALVAGKLVGLSCCFAAQVSRPRCEQGHPVCICGVCHPCERERLNRQGDDALRRQNDKRHTNGR